jgi:hypothetical protein
MACGGTMSIWKLPRSVTTRRPSQNATGFYSLSPLQQAEATQHVGKLMPVVAASRTAGESLVAPFVFGIGRRRSRWLQVAGGHRCQPGGSYSGA